MRLLYPVLLCFILPVCSLHAQAIRMEKVASRLLEKIDAEPEAFHSINIVLADRVNLTALDAQLSTQRASASQRSETVISTLTNKAQESQADLLYLLKNSPHVSHGSVNSYWIGNVIFAKAQKEIIAALSRRTDVEWIGLNGQLELEKYEVAPPPPAPPVPGGREPGLGIIKAPALWAMGYTGYGQLAFTNDTGIDPAHPAIASRYRGLYAPVNEAWFEYNPLTGQQAEQYTPVDCNGHGTHVNGTILGLDRLNNDTLGVAFNAQWIGSPVIACSPFGTEEIVAAFQWSLDPDGNPATTDDMPDIINNSWYDNALTESDCFSVYVAIEEAMEAAGIAVVFSAGNAGPGPMTITPPHNINIHEVSAFTVGALDGGSPALPIANFSSRGPSQCGGDSSILIKPEVSAPGVSVRSCVPGNKYNFFSGTSMAAPHVSGAILLLKEAFPDLTGKDLKLALYHTCIDLGEPGEDNTYGMGVIDVLAAFNYLVGMGHVPVSPYVANDVMLVDVNIPSYSCEAEISTQITVENAGTDTLFSFIVKYDSGTFSQTSSWAGALAPRERTTWALPPLQSAPGYQILTFILENPNDTADDRPLNNRLQGSVFVTSRAPFQVEIEGATNTLCENSSALLRGVFDEPGVVTVKWFDTPTGGSTLGEGIVFATPPLAQSAAFYAEAAYTQPLGLKNKSAGAEASDDIGEAGLHFQVFAPIRLKSVKAYADAVGSRVFLVKNQNGGTVKQKIVSFPTPGETTANLGWDLEPGIYSLVKALGKPLYYNTSGASYPYSLDGVVQIIGSAGGAGNQEWYYFYDWQIEYREPCGRTPVPVEVVPGGNIPTVSFSVSADSIDLTHSGQVQFTDTSTGDVTGWLWNFGDGTTSTGKNPSHTYTSPGIYIVSLSALGAGGCTSFALDTILVTKSEVSGTQPVPAPSVDGIAVFPNPVGDAIQVHVGLSAAQSIEMELFDTTGRVMRKSSFASVQAGMLQIDTSNLSSGVYFLLVEMGNGKSVWKVVKI